MAAKRRKRRKGGDWDWPRKGARGAKVGIGNGRKKAQEAQEEAGEGDGLRERRGRWGSVFTGIERLIDWQTVLSRIRAAGGLAALSERLMKHLACHGRHESRQGREPLPDKIAKTLFPAGFSGALA